MVFGRTLLRTTSSLAHLYATPGVSATRSYVALSTQLERPVQPGVTRSWAVPEKLERAGA
jgi:Lrp/AsnC family transcriptional regulator, leucine-responsive regulatory protein